MGMKRKTLTAFFSLLLVLLLAACSGSNEITDGDTNNTKDGTSSGTEEKKEDENNSAKEGKRLTEYAKKLDTEMLDMVEEFEGGCTEDNLTYKGVRQQNWDEYISVKYRDLPKEEIKEKKSKICIDREGQLSDEQVKAYYDFYWRGDNLFLNPPRHDINMYPYMTYPLAFVMFDTRVNTGDGFDDVPGPNGAIEMLQEVLNNNVDEMNVTVNSKGVPCKETGELLCLDGGIGELTKEALKSVDKKHHLELARQILDEREKFHCKTGTSDLPGWLNRVDTLRKMLDKSEEEKKITFVEKSEVFANEGDAINYCTNNVPKN